MSNWTENYMGLSFKEDGRDRSKGIDCWGLVRLVYEDLLSITLPLYEGTYTDQSQESLRRVVKTIETESKKWESIEKPREFDLVVLRIKGRPFHVGIVVGKWDFLHIMSGINSTVESLNGLLWKKRIVRFLRYVG